MSEIHQQLSDKIKELQQIRLVREHTSNLQKRLAVEEQELVLMERVLDKEQKDVELLEREGLNTMFHKFLGNREEKLETERQEYLKASLKFNELYKSVELIRFELDLLQKKEQNHDNVQAQIETLIKQREEELLQTNSQAALEIKGIYEQTDRLDKFSGEVEEALNAGLQSMDYVRKTEHYLLQAQSLGQRDMWGGRTYNTGEYKHQAIDQARQMAYQSRHALIKFGNELHDVFSNVQVQLKLEIEEFGKFADIFFDNLITDWVIQAKIQKSLHNVVQTRQQVEFLMQQLELEKKKITEKLDALVQKRKETVVRSE